MVRFHYLFGLEIFYEHSVDLSLLNGGDGGNGSEDSL